MNDLISRQAAKSKKVYSHERHEYVVPVAELDWLPSVQSEIEDKILAIGYTGKEGRIYIHGRLFSVRELPQ